MRDSEHQTRDIRSKWGVLRPLHENRTKLFWKTRHTPGNWIVKASETQLAYKAEEADVQESYVWAVQDVEEVTCRKQVSRARQNIDRDRVRNVTPLGTWSFAST